MILLRIICAVFLAKTVSSDIKLTILVEAEDYTALQIIDIPATVQPIPTGAFLTAQPCATTV